jgi:hypothetical protein
MPQTREAKMNGDKTRHTPGPWKVSDKMMTDDMICRHDAIGAWLHSRRCIEGAGKLLANAESNEPIGPVYNGGHPQVASRDEMLANARLIAAAPELLDALRLVLAHDGALTGADWETIRAAVDKAEGGAAG